MTQIDGTKNLRKMMLLPNITPWCGIMLAILICFMVNAPMEGRKVNITLPDAINVQKDFENCDIIVFISLGGGIWLDECNVDDESEFLCRLKELMKKYDHYRICLRADKDLPYARIEQVLKLAQKADVDIVGMTLTESTWDE